MVTVKVSCGSRPVYTLALASVYILWPYIISLRWAHACKHNDKTGRQAKNMSHQNYRYNNNYYSVKEISTKRQIGNHCALVIVLVQCVINLLCQSHLPDVSHGSGQGGPGDRLQPSSLHPLSQNSQIYEIGIALILGFDGGHTDSSVILEEEGSQHGVVDADQFGDVYKSGLGRKAYQEGKSGRVTCTHKAEHERKYYTLLQAGG